MIYQMIFVAFIFSLFVGTTKVCWGLGIAFAIMSVIVLADEMGFLD